METLMLYGSKSEYVRVHMENQLMYNKNRIELMEQIKDMLAERHSLKH